MRNPLGHSDNVKALFGLSPKAKWPTEGMLARAANGYVIWVTPLPAGKPRHRRMTHRALAQCRCGVTVSAGRIHQHKCKEV